jgi:DNA transformation protein and related proteins
MSSPEFIEYLLEQLRPLGAVSARRMFGGYGVYYGARMFGLVADDQLYLKTDDQNRGEFEAQDLKPFVYQTDSRSITMSYSEAPAEALDDGELLRQWAQSAIAAAGRASKATGGKLAKKKTGKPRSKAAKTTVRKKAKKTAKKTAAKRRPGASR